jgi:hypothetical protein
MKEPNSKNRKALAVLPDRKPYSVGHGKPPEATRFKLGQVIRSCLTSSEDDYLKTMIEYKTEWEMELERRKFQGVTTLPDPLPHPDDIIVDCQKNTVSLRGPMDKRELADLDLWITRRHDHEAELQSFMEDKNNPDYATYLDQLDRDIIYTKRILKIINIALALRASPQYIQMRLAQLNLNIPDNL